MNFFESLTDGSLMPHGHCLLWRPDLLFTHAVGDFLTVTTHFAIPPAFLIIRRHRKDLALDPIMLMFAMFIFLCGVTHLMGLINIWQGFYAAQGLAKLVTGAVSIATAIMVWMLLPRVLAIPTEGALITNSRVLQSTREDIIAAEAQLADLKQRISARESELAALGDGGNHRP